MKKHKINLSEADREWLYRYTESGSRNHQAFKRAQILLAVDEYSQELKDTDIAKILAVSPMTIYSSRTRYFAGA